MKFFNKNIFNDKGSVHNTITAFITIIFCFLIAGGVIELTKNYNIKHDYSKLAQNAAETSIQTVSPSGSLNIETVNKFIKDYDDLKYSKTSTQHNRIYEGDTCNTVKVNGIEKTAPYFEITLSTDRSQKNSKDSVKYVSSNSEEANLVEGNSSSNNKYTIITATVYDSTPNLFLPILGQKCQQYNTPVSAIIFGSDSEVNIEEE